MIKKIIINKFKGINSLEILPEGNFNVLIGENNIGKTTIFEAIHLWKMCYDLNLKKDKNGFYATAKNMKFEDMEFIRVYHDEDIFPVGCNARDAECKIILELLYNEQLYSLGFIVEKVSSIDDAYLQICYVDAEEFKRFAQMVASVPGKNLATFIAINESKPIPNIIAKEPYMFKAQVMDKIAKGKSYEVLRNKVKDHMEEVQNHINHVMESEFSFTEHDKDNKTYISIRVDGKDLFSFGSGFLQLTEIFSSMEYVDPAINILLIDEPDAHLHLKLQKKLIQEFRAIPNSQLFIITHNERFLEQVPENEILFVNENVKEEGVLKPLPQGTKAIALENLKGCLEQIDELRYAQRIIAIEGHTDKKFFDAMMPIYESYTCLTPPKNVFLEMLGIDNLNSKLITYSRVLKGIIPDSCKWLIIRDTDCVPCNKTISAGNDDKKYMDTSAEVKVMFQNGYGIESTFASDPEILARLLTNYYGLPEIEKQNVKVFIDEVSREFDMKSKLITDIDVHQELKKHFERQIKQRSGRTYDNLKFEDVLRHITANNIQYVLTKNIMDKYLNEIHNKIVSAYSNISAQALKNDSIFTYYYSWISSIDDIIPSHKLMLEEIYSYD